MGRCDPLVLWLALLSCALNLTLTICGFIPSQANTEFAVGRQPNFQRGISHFRGNNFGGRNFEGFLNGHYPINFAPNSYPNAIGNQRGGNNFIRGLRPQHSYSRSQPGGSHGYSRRHIRDVTSDDVSHRRVRRQAGQHTGQHMTWNFHPDNRIRQTPNGVPSHVRNSPKVILSSNGNAAGKPNPSIVASGHVKPSIVKLASRTNVDPPYHVPDPQQTMLGNLQVLNNGPQSAGRARLQNTVPTNSQTNIQNSPNIGPNTNFLLDNFFPQMQPELLGLNDNPLVNTALSKSDIGNAHSTNPNLPDLHHGVKNLGLNQNSRLGNTPALTAGNNRIVMNNSQRVFDNVAGLSSGNSIRESQQQVLPGNNQILSDLPVSQNMASRFINLQTDKMGGQLSSSMQNQEMLLTLPNIGTSSSASAKAQTTGLSDQHPNGHGALHLSPKSSATGPGVVNSNANGHAGMVHNLGSHPQSRFNLHRGSNRVKEPQSRPGRGRVGKTQSTGSLKINAGNLGQRGTGQIPNAVTMDPLHINHAGHASVSLQNSNINPATNLRHATHKANIDPLSISNAILASSIIENVKNQIPSMTATRPIKRQSPALGILPPKQILNNQRVVPSLLPKQTLTNQSPIPNLPSKQTLTRQTPIPDFQPKNTLINQRVVPNMPQKQTPTNERPIPNLRRQQSQTNSGVNPNAHANHMGVVSGTSSGQGLTSSINVPPLGPLEMGLAPNQFLPRGVNKADIFQQIQGLTIKDLAKSNYTRYQILNALAHNFKTRDSNNKNTLTNKGSVKQNLGNGLAEVTTNPNMRFQNTLNGASGIPNTALNNQVDSLLHLGQGPNSPSLAELELLKLHEIPQDAVPAPLPLNNPASLNEFPAGGTYLNVANSKTPNGNLQSKQIMQSVSETMSGAHAPQTSNLGISSNHANTNHVIQSISEPRPAVHAPQTSGLDLSPNYTKTILRSGSRQTAMLNSRQTDGNMANGNLHSSHISGSLGNVKNLPSRSMPNNIAPPNKSGFPKTILRSGSRPKSLRNLRQTERNSANSNLQTSHVAGSTRNMKALPDGPAINNIASSHNTIPPQNNRVNNFGQDNHMNIHTKRGMEGGIQQMKLPSSAGLSNKAALPTGVADINNVVPQQQISLPESTGLQNAASFQRNVKSRSSNPRKPNASHRPGSKPELPGGVRVEHWLFSEMGKIMSSKSIPATTTTTTTTTPTTTTTVRPFITQQNVPVPTAEQIASRNGRRPSRKVKTRGRRRRKKMRKRIRPNRVRSRLIIPGTTHAPRIIKASVDRINTSNKTNSKQDSRLKRRKINITKETRIVTRPIGPPVNPQTNLLLSQIVKELKKSATTPSPLNQDINHKLSQILDLLKTNSNPTNNPFGIVPTTAPPFDVLQLLGGAPNTPQMGGASLGAASTLLALGNGDASNSGQQNQLNPIEMLVMSNILSGNAAPGQASGLSQLLTGMGSNGAMSLGQNGTSPEQNMNSTLVQAMVQQMVLNNDNNNNGCGCYPKVLGCPNDLFPRNGLRWKHLIQCKKDETRCCDDN